MTNINKSLHPLIIREEQEVWSRIYQYLQPYLENHASSLHKTGIQQLGLKSDVLPDFSEFADSVFEKTGWNVTEVEGELGAVEFFQELAEKSFPLVRRMRPIDQLYGGIDPDFWHEAFGHIPPLTHPSVSDLYLWFGKAGVHAAITHSTFLDKISKLYWSIAEYGFLSERRKTKLFGAALIGSPLAAERYLAGKIRTKPFSIQKALSSDYDPHRYHPFYFEMKSIEKTLLDLKNWYPHVD